MLLLILESARVLVKSDRLQQMGDQWASQLQTSRAIPTPFANSRRHQRMAAVAALYHSQ
jgi:hypothetical protein